MNVGYILLIIAGVLLAGVGLFLLYHFVISRNRIKHQVRELEKKYSYLDALLIGQDSQYIHRLEIISRTNLLYVDKHEKFSRRFKEVYENDDKFAESMIRQLNALINNKQKSLIFHQEKCGKLYPHIYIIYFYLFISFSITKYKYRDSFVDKK